MARYPVLLHRVNFALALVILAPLGSSADTPSSDKGYRDVKVQSGGKTTVVRVKDSVGPRLHGESAGGPYNPENMDLGRTSSFADKSFSTRNSALSKNDTAAEARGDNHFLTKSFSGTKPDSTSDLNRKYQTSSYTKSSRASDDFHRSFATSSSSMTQDKDVSFASKTSDLQGRTANLGGPQKAPFSGLSDLSNKTFTDPEMTHVKRDPFASANGLDVSRMVDLPNRPLTIDEVRNLINHETIPNLDAKPDAASKPLNDSGYEPPTAAPMAHDDLAPPGPEEKDAGLPSPGMMATPESSEPLPK
jgi:hypothetical protein